MSYRSANTSNSPEAVAKSLSNVGITSATGDQATVQFLSGLGDAPVELNAGEYDACIAFFTNKDYLFKPYLNLLFVIALQILLGILVLFTDVNIVVASLHQISSILLIILSLKLYHRSFY